MLDTVKQTHCKDIEFQDASIDVWDKKYRLKDANNTPVDSDMKATFARVAKAIAGVETSKDKQKKWESKFLWALENGAVPAGRIISNAGAEAYKPSTSTINCTVSGTIGDSMREILNANTLAGLTLKAGCGIGYEFSTLRPNGAMVAGAGAKTNGPMAFMDIFDKMCFTVSSAGGRRGAQMGTFDVSHPDVFEFIKAKREDGRLRQFNLSLLVTDAFMQAVKTDSMWALSFPVTQAELESEGLDLSNPDQIEWRDAVKSRDEYIEHNGLLACKIYRKVKARTLMNVIMSSTYDFAEPGFILIDKVNEMNNNWFCEKIRATNPCGEQPLPPNGSCLLGSVNLTKFVVNPFTENAYFDTERFEQVVAIFTRMLDNVVEINGLPLEEQRTEITRKRRHGMGYLGLGSVFTMLGMDYGDEESVNLTHVISRSLAIVGWKTGVELAKEKGAAPVMDEKFEVTEEMLAKRPELKETYKLGDMVPGKVLHALYSRYMQSIASEAPGLIDEMVEHGCRFTHHSSIAPTGTISLSMGNNASNGIEPSFAHHYARNIIREGKKAKEKVDVYSFELLAYKKLVNKKVEVKNLPPIFKNADSVSPKCHVDIQAAAQKWIDSSISKTINVATDIDFNNFQDIYMYGYEKGLKGCTTFRFNPENFQGVLVKEEDLANTTYKFTLEDGSTIELRGNDEVEYEGEIYTAANLYDAHKEGYYGKL